MICLEKLYLYVCQDVVKDDKTRFYLSFLLAWVFGYVFSTILLKQNYILLSVCQVVNVSLRIYVCCVLSVGGCWLIYHYLPSDWLERLL